MRSERERARGGSGVEGVREGDGGGERREKQSRNIARWSDTAFKIHPHSYQNINYLKAVWYALILIRISIIKHFQTYTT